MTTLALSLWKDEAGFIISAELILIATIAVLAMVVGLAEVSGAINQELEDVASAFGSVNQSYRYQGLTGHGGYSGGGCFEDGVDFCDSANDINGSIPTGEGGYGHHNW
jgi:Flp pilus assembly pilin Flp